MEGIRPFEPRNYKYDGSFGPKKVEYHIYLDTETVCNLDDGGRLHMVIGCAVIYRQTVHGFERIGDWEFNDSDEFFIGLRNIIDETEGSIELVTPAPIIKIWAHNWNFDAAVIKIGSPELMRKYDYDIEIGSGIQYNPERRGMSPFILDLQFPRGDANNPDSYTSKGKRKYRLVRLIDSTNFFKQPLEEVMDALGLKKEELATVANEEGKEPEVTYQRFKREPEVCRNLLRKRCKSDTEGLAKAMIHLTEFGLNNFNTRPVSTIARMAVASFACSKEYAEVLKTMEDSPINTELRFVHRILDKSYIGGRSDSFYKGKPSRGRLWKYDVVSMYPSIMLDYVPTNYIHTVKDKELIKKVVKHCKHRDDRIYLARVDIYVPEEEEYGFEGHSQKNRGVCFFTGHMKNKWVWQDTVEYGLERGYIRRIREVLVFKAAPIFKDYVKRLADMKKKYKDEGNKIMKMCVKLLLNSLYGKFGGKSNGKWVKETRPHKLQMLRDRFAGRDRAKILLYGKNKFGERLKEDFYKDFKGNWCSYKSSGDIYDYSSVPSIASYITSRARLKLLKSFNIIKEELGGRVYYCDTDSLFVNIDLVKANHPYIPIGSELGEWELEEGGDDKILHANQCCFNAPKDYYTPKVVKIKGIRKPVRDIREYEQDQFPNFSTILKRDSKTNVERIEQGGCIVKIKKTVGGKNHKRNEPARGDGWTTPIHATI